MHGHWERRRVEPGKLSHLVGLSNPHLVWVDQYIEHQRNPVCESSVLFPQDIASPKDANATYGCSVLLADLPPNRLHGILAEL
jgi:hypothetical protein